jgi:4,5-DOPA dioxygenase extradiol
MPLLFVGHGSPMNIVQKNEFTDALRQAGQSLPKPRCILCVSAHWVTDGTFVTGAAQPKQIYDFYGFPDELYKVTYRASGSLLDSGRIAKLGKDIPVSPNNGWGIDHGTWAVLHHLYPQADIPVIQLSLDGNKDEAGHFKLASFLRPLRSEGVLIIGSGNIVHNLRLISWQQFGEAPFPWAQKFDDQVKEALDRKDNDLLVKYDSKDRESGKNAVPTNEHYLPLLYIAALRGDTENIEYIHEGFQHRSVSMRSFIVR